MKPVLAIRHHLPHELGVAAEVFDELGVPYRYLDAWAERDWPGLDDVSALIVLGGEMNADEVDRYPFLGRERTLLRQAVERDLPVMGICLGAQVLARAMGADIRRSPVPELGFRPVSLTAAGLDDPLTAPFRPRPEVFQWHVDTFDLPDGAVLLGVGDDVPHQAFRIGRSAYAFQFHLEATKSGIAAWCKHWAADLREHWATTPEAVMHDVRERHAAQRSAARESFRALVELAREPVRPLSGTYHPAKGATTSSGTRPASTSERARSKTSRASRISLSDSVRGGVSSSTFERRPT